MKNTWLLICALACVWLACGAGNEGSRYYGASEELILDAPRAARPGESVALTAECWGAVAYRWRLEDGHRRILARGRGRSLTFVVPAEAHGSIVVNIAAGDGVTGWTRLSHRIEVTEDVGDAADE